MAVDYTGERFGKLVVISFAEEFKDSSGRKRRRWLCRCDCRNQKYVTEDNLKRTTSCGCNRASACWRMGINNQKHGDAKDGHRTRLYIIWSGIKSRCYNANDKEKYYRYGGRGIKMCPEWKNDYSVFKNWALANGYDDSLSIDRIDFDGDYTPENCRWATHKEQQNNLSTNRHVRDCGEVFTVAQLSDLYDVPHHIILKRLNKGWSDEKIMNYVKQYGKSVGGDTYHG